MILTVIQARTGSTRLPAKVFKDIGGKSLIDRVVERAERIGYPVCIAIPIDDFGLKVLCQDRRWSFVEGPEHDLLDRYVMAARAFDADHVIRVTSDCPFIDVEAARWTVDHHVDSGADYTTFHLAEGRGVEVFTRQALLRSQAEANDPWFREHIDEYILAHPNDFRIEWMKFSVDTLEDLELARRRAGGKT